MDGKAAASDKGSVSVVWARHSAQWRKAKSSRTSDGAVGEGLSRIQGRASTEGGATKELKRTSAART